MVDLETVLQDLDNSKTESFADAQSRLVEIDKRLQALKEEDFPVRLF